MCPQAAPLLAMDETDPASASSTRKGVDFKGIWVASFVIDLSNGPQALALAQEPTGFFTKLSTESVHQEGRATYRMAERCGQGLDGRRALKDGHGPET
jgi:hypothetical protein